MRYRLLTLLIVFAILRGSRTAADLNAAETGTLKMRFVYDGEPPSQKTLNVGESGVAKRDESLVIDKATRGIQNVCVWLLRTPGDLFAVDDGKQRDDQKQLMTLKGGNFSPRIAILRTPQTVVIRNTDTWGYNIVSDSQGLNRPFSELLKPGDSIEKRVEFREPYPIRLHSSIHPWVTGYILALDQPHAAISDTDGRLTISDIPTGNWGFVVWHERSAAVKKAVHKDQSIEWPGGVMWYTIKPGENDRGEFALRPDQPRLR